MKTPFPTRRYSDLLVLNIATLPGRHGGFGSNGRMAQKIPAAAFGDGVVDESEVSDPILIAFDDRGDLHDKNTMTADPHDPDFVYAVDRKSTRLNSSH